MTTESNKALIRRWIEAGWNGHDTALVDTLYAPNVVQHDPSSPMPVTSSEALKQYVASFLTALPDIHFTIDDLLAEGDKVLWRFTAQGTQSGPLMTIPPRCSPRSLRRHRERFAALSAGGLRRNYRWCNRP